MCAPVDHTERTTRRLKRFRLTRLQWLFVLLARPSWHFVIRVFGSSRSLSFTSTIRAHRKTTSIAAISQVSLTICTSRTTSVAFVTLAQCMSLAVPEGHLIKPVFCWVRWPRLRASRLFTRRVAAFITAIDKLAMHPSVCFAGLSALVATHLDLVLAATPCPHLIESVFGFMRCIWPRFGAARRIT